METNTIKKIKEIHEQIEEELTSYQKHYKDNNQDMNSCNWGQEKEYCINGIIGGIKNILTDISFLCRSHNVFIQISSYNERYYLSNQLNILNTNLRKKDNPNIVNCLEAIKAKLRPYHLRVNRDRLVDFTTEINNLRRLALDLENDISAVKSNLAECNDIQENVTKSKDASEKVLDDLIAKKNDFIETLDAFTTEYSDFQQLAKKASDNEKIVSDKLKEIEQEKTTFDKFVENIAQREETLSKQAAATQEYNEKLTNYTSEHEKKLKEAQDLIEEAKKALNYKNAEGLSAAFSEKLSSASNMNATLWWIGGAFFFIILTLLIGAWIVAGWGIKSETSTNQMWFNLIGRLCMIPFTITAAVFCANQYTKQKNIIEDYAYKTTVAKSIIAFSEELREKDPERYAEYISTVLKEIHQDPLRKREKDSNNVIISQESANLIEKLITLIPTWIK